MRRRHQKPTLHSHLSRTDATLTIPSSRRVVLAGNALGFRSFFRGGTGQHADDRHHPLILVVEDVAMIDEVADILSAKIQPHRHARILVVWISVPEWNVDHVEQLPLQRLYRLAAVLLEIILRHHHEMDLVDVEFVILLRAVLDRPVLDRALRRLDSGRIVGRENHRRRSVDGYEKLRLIRIL